MDPPEYSRAPVATSFEPFEQQVRQLLKATPSMPATVLAERVGWTGSATWLLSPEFQARVGGYGNYRGFWSTIASVVVGQTTSAGHDAVDVSLTYTSRNGHVDDEVRRIYLVRTDDGVAIAKDAVLSSGGLTTTRHLAVELVGEVQTGTAAPARTLCGQVTPGE